MDAISHKIGYAMGAEIVDLQSRLDNALEKIGKLEIENDRLNDLLEDAESKGV